MRSLPLISLSILILVACAPPGSTLAGTPRPSLSATGIIPAHTTAPALQPTIPVAQPTTPQLDANATPGSTLPLAEFPLANGTTWVYSYDAYDTSPANPTGITTATYLFTDKVIDTQSVPPFFVAHVQHVEHLVKAAPDWVDTGPIRPDEFWYVVNGQQVYTSPPPLDLTKIQLDDSFLAYAFPLVVGKSWCPYTYLKGVRVQDCTASGRKSVVSQESHITPAGDFTQCYKITEDFNSGGVTQWFCNGIGVVAEKYDHAGTRFGFQESLVNYSKGSP